MASLLRVLQYKEIHRDIYRFCAGGPHIALDYVESMFRNHTRSKAWCGQTLVHWCVGACASMPVYAHTRM